MKVVVAGGGVIGLSIARAITARGIGDVVVLERAALGSGGTGKSSGVVRCHYGVPSLAAMAWKSVPYFEAAGSEVGFHQVGYVVGVGAEDEEALRANVEMHQGLGIDVDLIKHDQVEQLWPYAHLSDFAAFAYEPRGGYADASQTAFAFGREARAAGARIEQGSPVAGVATSGDRVTGVVTADGSTIEADVVVLATGAWSPALLDPLGVRFPVHAQRSELLMVDAGEPLVRVPVLSDLVSLQYVRPEVSGHLIVGTSDHSSPEYADPDDYSNRASQAGIEKAGAKVLHRFPGFPDASVATTYAGCYDVTPDYNPVIAPVGPAGLFLAAGFSGHGFKISPAVGELVADLVLTGTSQDPLVPAADFRLERFAEGTLLQGVHRYLGAGQMR